VLHPTEFLHENLRVQDEESPKQKAIRLLNRQLGQLQTIRGFNDEHPDFKVWRDTTREILERFLGKESHHTTRFRDTRFYGRSFVQSDYPGRRRTPDNVISQAHTEAFQKGCATADASLRAGIKHVEDFGVHVEEAKPVPAGRGRDGSGGVNFNAPITVQNLAIAADDAIQKIGHMGDATGASLKEIAALLQQSEELSRRQVKEGLAGIEGLAEEIQKPEPKRNWKAVLAYGQAVLEIAGKATDLAQKLAPYTPTVAGLVEKACDFIK
jgi:hypothetical protein